MSDFVPKAEFVRRLKRLYNDLDRIFYGDGNFGNFFPHFFSLIVYFWSFPKPYLFKHRYNDIDIVCEDASESDDEQLPFPDCSPYPDDVPFPFDSPKYGK